MGYYRKKPAVIEAVQWTGKNKMEVLELCGNALFHKGGSCVEIATNGKSIKADLEDFIIKGLNDVFYVCSPGLFMELYEEATGAEWAQYRYDRETISPDEAYKILLGEEE